MAFRAFFFWGGGDSLQALGQLGFYTKWRLGCFFWGGSLQALGQLGFYTMWRLGCFFGVGSLQALGQLGFYIFSFRECCQIPQLLVRNLFQAPAPRVGQWLDLRVA